MRSETFASAGQFLPRELPFAQCWISVCPDQSGDTAKNKAGFNPVTDLPLPMSAATPAPVEPETLVFTDGGSIPNNPLPLLLYRQAVASTESGTKLAEALEHLFTSHGWSGIWRDGVYPFHHYHSNTHEVLGVYQGRATLALGGSGPAGRRVAVQPGDILVIPAGVGHQCEASSGGFRVVGAYPGGLDPDLLRGDAGERPGADRRIGAVPMPEEDPVTGRSGALITLWGGTPCDW
jgi:uncharacterized protein YjlB